MKVVLDSNILFAYFSSYGICHDLTRKCLDHHEVCLSDAILNETRDAMQRKEKLKPDEDEIFTLTLKEGAFLFNPLDVPLNACRDPKDRHVLGLAAAAQADMIVTGDKDLLVLKRYKGIEILAPREALLRLSD
jgi:uncharacterized protein